MMKPFDQELCSVKTPLKAFDLEAAKAGKPIQQRNGVPVRFIAHIPDALNCSRIIVMVETTKLISHRDEAGRYNGAHHNLDLVMAPIKKTYWANVWRDRASVFVGKLFANEAEATENKRMIESASTYYTYLKTISFEIEE